MTNQISEFSKAVDPKLVNPLRQVLKGRKLVSVTTPKGFEITSVDWSKITEMSGGMVSYSFTSGNKDKLDVTPTNTKIPVHWKDFEMDRREFDSWRKRGEDPEAANALAAGYQAAKVENTVLIMGVSNDGTNYDQNGLYMGAGLDYNTSTSLDTFGNATTCLSGAINMMDDAGMPVDSIPLNWAVNSTSFYKLRKIRNSIGIREWQDLLDLLNGGSIVSVGTTLSSARGFVLPDSSVGEPYLDYYLTADFQTDMANPKFAKTGNIEGRVFSAGALRIKQDVAICRMSALS